jgi:NadR type nicotinamide-nucleotide adenylyltransferase
LTGAECTGKSTLAAQLAQHYGAVVVDEYAREYAERVKRDLTYVDVEAIAGGQLANEDRALAVDPSTLVIHDTDLISTYVYARHHYGHCPPWIAGEARARRSPFYLLMDIDKPWIADGVRDSDARREALHREFEEALREFGALHVTISGAWEERLQRAIEAIDVFSSTR